MSKKSRAKHLTPHLLLKNVDLAQPFSKVDLAPHLLLKKVDLAPPFLKVDRNKKIDIK
jgi:hypothetical protein